jgi:hypothetical protein
MLADGERILFLWGAPNARTIVNTSSTISLNSADHTVFYAVVVAGCAVASASSQGRGVVPTDLGRVDLADEGTRWVRGWDQTAREALLAANKLTESVDAAE